MSIGGSSENAFSSASARSYGPGWHIFEPPVAIGYSSGKDWIEVIDLPARSNMTAEELAACFVESGIKASRAERKALRLEEAHERLEQQVQRLTSVSSFRNAFMRSAKGEFQDPIAIIEGVDLVRPITPWYIDQSLTDSQVVDTGLIVLSVYGASFEGALESRTIGCGQVDDIEFSMQLGTMHIDAWADEWHLRNVTASGLAALYALKHIDPDMAVRGTVQYVEGWLDDPAPRSTDVDGLLEAVKRVHKRSPQTNSYQSSLPVSAIAPRMPEPSSSDKLPNGEPMPIVDFFLDEESMPMPLSVVHDPDGPEEVQAMLGTFSNKSEALSAVDVVRQFLQEGEMRWGSVAEALSAVQFIALRCRGNAGLPLEVQSGQQKPASVEQQDLAAKVIESPVFAMQRSRAQRITLSDIQVRSFIRSLVVATSHRLDPSSASKALGVPPFQFSGAFSMVQRLLNVDQYPVLVRDADGISIVLDVAMLQEQFGVGV